MLLIIQGGKSVDEMMRIFENKVSHDYYNDIFSITYDRMKKYEGDWHTENAPCIPGTFFVETEYEVKAFEQLAYIYMEGSVAVVSSEVEDILKRMCDENHHIGMSVGIIKNGMTKITEGPLFGLEKHVKKIDRHKRLAWLEFEIDDNMKLKMQAGLEIISKC